MPSADPPAEPTVATADRDSTGVRPATSAERVAIDELSRAAESIRQLRLARPVVLEIEDGETIARSLYDQIDQDEIERAAVLYGALGLLDPDADLRTLFSGVLGEQVIGYYDPESGRLVVREDIIDGLLGAEGPAQTEEARLVLVHELVHALQDQRLGLGNAYGLDRTADEDNAFRAVIEGDATLAMLANTLRDQGIPLAAATRRIEQMGNLLDISAFVQGEKLDDAPALVRVTLVAPYIRGLQFAAAVYSDGGWPSVNRAHRAAPKTTEQILHPDKYRSGEIGEPVAVPRIPAVDASGFERIDEDTLGELELGVYLGQGLASGTDEAAAAGWAGDRVVIYRRGNTTAAVWFTLWDDEGEAQEAQIAARRATPKGTKSIVERTGRAVLIVRGLPARFHPPVRDAFEAFARATAHER